MKGRSHSTLLHSSIGQLRDGGCVSLEGKKQSLFGRGVTCATVFATFLIFLHSSRAFAARSVCRVPSR